VPQQFAHADPLRYRDWRTEKPKRKGDRGRQFAATFPRVFRFSPPSEAAALAVCMSLCSSVRRVLLSQLFLPLRQLLIASPSFPRLAVTPVGMSVARDVPTLLYFYAALPATEELSQLIFHTFRDAS